MYWIVDGLCFVAGLAQFIWALNTSEQKKLCWIGPVWIATYPVVLQFLYNSLTALFGTKCNYSVVPKSRFVYSPGYNISFCGIEKCHPFDSQKYLHIVEFLTQRGKIREQDLMEPSKPPRSLLAQKMSYWYLLKLCYTIPVCMAVEMPLIFIPGFLLRWRVLDPQLRATQGSILAACIASKLGWAVNLSGGYHHSSFNSGGGFCIYPDISLVVHYLRTRLNLKKIMVVDLDAHQGNGHERDHLNDPDVYTVDAYNHGIYPGDREARAAITHDIRVNGGTSDREYIEQVRSIERDIEQFQPQFVIYNAGTDILEGDELGRMDITAEGVIDRDQTMIEMCTRRKIPVVMLMSGGYQQINAKVIADSIENLLKKFDR